MRGKNTGAQLSSPALPFQLRVGLTRCPIVYTLCFLLGLYFGAEMDSVLTVDPLIQRCHSPLGWILLSGLICYQMISFQGECVISRSRHIWKYPLLLLFLTDTLAQAVDGSHRLTEVYQNSPCSPLQLLVAGETFLSNEAYAVRSWERVSGLGNISFLWLKDRQGLPGLALFILPWAQRWPLKVDAAIFWQLANVSGAWIGSPQCQFRFLLFRKVRRAETLFCRIACS